MKLFDREDRATNKQNAVITKTQHTLHRCAEIHSRMLKKNKTSSLLTVYASFLQVKHWSTELEEELQRDIKKVSYDWNQGLLGGISTIIHLMTYVGGQEILNGQQAKFVDCSTVIFQINIETVK